MRRAGWISKGDESLVQAAWMALKGACHGSPLRCVAKEAVTKVRTWALRRSRFLVAEGLHGGVQLGDPAQQDRCWTGYLYAP